MATKSSVASVPALINIELTSPGWSSKYSVQSYTLSFTMIHASSSIQCLATSAKVYFFAASDGGGGAGADTVASFYGLKISASRFHEHLRESFFRVGFTRLHMTLIYG
jgi:hypothetical protein